MSFVERKKSDTTLAKQYKVLRLTDYFSTDSLTRDNLLDQLMEGFQLITPYFDSCQDANKLLEDWCKRGE